MSSGLIPAEVMFITMLSFIFTVWFIECAVIVAEAFKTACDIAVMATVEWVVLVSLVAFRVNSYVSPGFKVFAAKLTLAVAERAIGAPFLLMQKPLVDLGTQLHFRVMPERTFCVESTSGSATVAVRVSAFWVETV